MMKENFPNSITLIHLGVLVERSMICLLVDRQVQVERSMIDIDLQVDR